MLHFDTDIVHEHNDRIIFIIAEKIPIRSTGGEKLRREDLFIVFI